MEIKRCPTSWPILQRKHFHSRVLELESRQKYILKIENLEADHKLKLMIEDRVNRFNFEFDRPHIDLNSGNILLGRGVKGMLARGPELRMEIIPPESKEDSGSIRILVFKGKKYLFKDDVLLELIDVLRLRRYLKENFPASKDETTIP